MHFPKSMHINAYYTVKLQLRNFLLLVTHFFFQKSVLKENTMSALPTTISAIVFLVRPWISYCNIIFTSILYKERTITQTKIVIAK